MAMPAAAQNLDAVLTLKTGIQNRQQCRPAQLDLDAAGDRAHGLRGYAPRAHDQLHPRDVRARQGLPRRGGRMGVQTRHQLHPLVAPQVLHFMQVPFLTRV